MATNEDAETAADARAAANNDEACPVIESFEQIGSQWRLVILYDLHGEEKRFNELKRSTGASSRTLSRVLDDLGDLGFVERRMEEASPVATYYSLTPKGESLCPVFEAVEHWAADWLDVQPESESTPDRLADEDGRDDQGLEAVASE